jgi:RNA polymerase sigma-70 factor (ECF subfamily)
LPRYALSLFVSILAGEIEVKAMKEIDAALVRACQRGDIEAFEQIFRVYRNPVFRLAYKFTGNRDDAEDLTQEIFLKVFENIGSFRYESSFATWLYRIAVNTCMNFQRDKKPAESLGVTDDLGSSVSPEAICEWGELQRKIEAEIASLPSPLKIAFLLVVVEGMTYREASEILGLSVDALLMRVSRARQILREKLKATWKGDRR